MAAKLCNVCDIRRPKTGSKGTEVSSHDDMCNYCYEEGTWENAHSDYDHEGLQAGTIVYGMTSHKTEAEFNAWLEEEKKFAASCWICHPELNLAKRSKKAGTGPKKPGTRRPQLNHKGHSHPQTPAARRVCKLAFWANIAQAKASGQAIQNEALPQLMANWDAKLDGHGKPLAPRVKLTVEPKGHVGAGLKTLAPKEKK